MQRCPKCGRTYEDNTQKFCTHDGGRLAPDEPQSSATAPTAYDLNQTVRTQDTFDPEATVTRMPDLNKTVAAQPTSKIRERETGPATPPPSQYQAPPTPPQTPPTVMFQQPQAPQQAPPAQPPRYYDPAPQQAPEALRQPHAQPHYPFPPQQREGVLVPPNPRVSTPRSRVPLIIGLVVILLAGGAAAWYFLIYKKGEATANSNANVGNANASTNENANSTADVSGSANTNTVTSEPPPPPNATRFTSSAAGLDGKLSEYFSNFSFYYPNTWERDPKAGMAGASNFVRVERRLPPDFTQENFAVSWYESRGTFEQDERDVFPNLVESLKSRYSKSFPEFKVLNEGETTVNGMKGYEFRFQSVSRGTEKGDITLWGRIVFLPPGAEGQKNGAQLLMLATSLAPELKSAEDVGVKGELPVILNSFRVGNNK